MVNQNLKATDNGSIHGRFLSLSGFVLLFKPLVFSNEYKYCLFC